MLFRSWPWPLTFPYVTGRKWVFPFVVNKVKCTYLLEKVWLRFFYSSKTDNYSLIIVFRWGIAYYHQCVMNFLFSQKGTIDYPHTFSSLRGFLQEGNPRPCLFLRRCVQSFLHPNCTLSHSCSHYFQHCLPKSGDCCHVLKGDASSGTLRNIKPRYKVILTSK